jgi:hypothetical protein
MLYYMIDSRCVALSRSAFGFPLDGCCGACPQENNAEGRVVRMEARRCSEDSAGTSALLALLPCPQMNWVDFWREYRLGSQLRMLRQKQPGDQLIQQKGAELMARLGELFIMLVVEDITPSLLHGTHAAQSGSASCYSR